MWEAATRKKRGMGGRVGCGKGHAWRLICMGLEKCDACIGIPSILIESVCVVTCWGYTQRMDRDHGCLDSTNSARRSATRAEA